ncbi:hypothetical protein ALC53_12589 [Atta colombica]|uniref:Uncharacterized protein n=1 Tax=Atta colombica TaxID=520822 RepID=A0A151HZ29_9HYME|nr:hypothetical protein ALC53_12589 [Atta colombica]
MWIESNNILIQEELAKLFSKLVHCLKTRKTIILYISCALQMLAVKWFNINHHRQDSFSMVVFLFKIYLVIYMHEVLDYMKKICGRNGNLSNDVIICHATYHETVI